MDRTCYKCANFFLCFMRRQMEQFIKGDAGAYLKIDANEEPPLGFQSLYDTLAQCCKAFKFKEDK